MADSTRLLRAPKERGRTLISQEQMQVGVFKRRFGESKSSSMTCRYVYIYMYMYIYIYYRVISSVVLEMCRVCHYVKCMI